MKVFLTGGTGYIGSAIAEALRKAGHEVIGLARSENSARKLEAAGIEPYPGNLRETGRLIEATRFVDCVVHAAMEWGPDMGAVDRGAVEAVLNGLAGSGKPFLYTSGTWLMGDVGEGGGGEDSPPDPVELVAWRPDVESLVTQSAGRSIRGLIVRPVEVYGRNGGEVAKFLQEGRKQGVVRYVGSGENHWSFVHIDALCRLYLLMLQKGVAGNIYMASSGEHRPMKEVAEAAAKASGAVAQSWPIQEARRELGAAADGLVLDQRIVAKKAEQELGWTHDAPGVLEEIEASR